MYVLAMLARLVFVPHLNKYYAYNVMIICSQTRLKYKLIMTSGDPISNFKGLQHA